MSTLGGLRPLVSRFSTPSSLRIVRSYSVATSSSYEHLLVSIPKAGVGLSKGFSRIGAGSAIVPVADYISHSNFEPAESPQRPL